MSPIVYDAPRRRGKKTLASKLGDSLNQMIGTLHIEKTAHAP